MRIVFIGSVAFSQHTLAHLLGMHANVVGVCTLAHSSFNADHVDLKPLCDQHNIPCRHTPEINGVDTLAWIESLKPDVIFCFGWSRLLKTQLLQLAPLGVIGFHPAALPANRGRHPIIWPLVLGMDTTASTFFFMNEGVDSGDILSQHIINIAPQDDAGDLYKKATNTALQQISVFVPDLTNGTYERQSQDVTKANTWRKRTRADGQIDWRMSAQAICNLVRGLAKPYVGAHFVLDDQDIKVWKAELASAPYVNMEPGKVLEITETGPIIKCGNDAVRLRTTEPEFNPAVGTYL